MWIHRIHRNHTALKNQERNTIQTKVGFELDFLNTDPKPTPSSHGYYTTIDKMEFINVYC